MFANASQRLKQQEQNCAFCSAAGAVNLICGHSEVTSNDVARELKVGQGAFQSAEGGGQDLNIINFVEQKTKRKCQTLVAHETSLTKALEKMKQQPSRTVFALHVSGKIASGGGDKSHWLNALSVNGSEGIELRFFDFQVSRDVPKEWKGAMRGKTGVVEPLVGSKNPASSLSPFIGIVAQSELSGEKSDELQHGRTPDATAHRAMHGANQTGTFLPNAARAVKILAFPP